MIADVDAANVITAAENGALYGMGLLWLLVLGYDIGASRYNLSAICNVLLGLIASKKGLMGTHSLRGPNRFLHWILLSAVVCTGIVSLVSQVV